jgi:hypothetical protein
MVLRPRDLWHKVFLSEARQRYLKDGGHEGVEVKRTKNETEARKEADEEERIAKKKAAEKKKAKEALKEAAAEKAKDVVKETGETASSVNAVGKKKASRKKK